MLEWAKEFGEFTLSDHRICYRAIIIKTVGHQNKERPPDIWHRTESSEISPSVYSETLFNNNTRQMGERIVFSINSVRTI